MTEYPQLAYLAQAYFHQDYDLDAPTPAGIIATYIANEPPAAIRQLAAEIKTMLDAGMTDSQIGHLWITTWHASYEPSKDGLSYRDWLTATHTALEAGTRTRQMEPASDPEPPEPWFRPDPQHSAALAAEAQAEIGADHELAGRKLTAILKCASCDEVIFRLDDGTFAQVHLTWARHPEPGPWPTTAHLGGFPALQTAIDNHHHQTGASPGASDNFI